MGRLTENSIVVLKNKSHSITAQIDVPAAGAHGTDRRPGRRVRRLEPLPQGRPAGVLLQPVRPAALQGRTATTRSRPASTRSGVEFAYDGGGLAKGGTATLFVDGSQVGEGRVDATVPMLFSGDETTDVGSDTGTPVTDDLVGAETDVHRPRPLGPARHRRRRRRTPTT